MSKFAAVTTILIIVVLYVMLFEAGSRARLSSVFSVVGTLQDTSSEFSGVCSSSGRGFQLWLAVRVDDLSSLCTFGSIDGISTGDITVRGSESLMFSHRFDLTTGKPERRKIIGDEYLLFCLDPRFVADSFATAFSPGKGFSVTLALDRAPVTPLYLFISCLEPREKSAKK
jgi:hypothetical protein